MEVADAQRLEREGDHFVQQLALLVEQVARQLGVIAPQRIGMAVHRRDINQSSECLHSVLLVIQAIVDADISVESGAPSTPHRASLQKGHSHPSTHPKCDTLLLSMTYG